MVITEVAAVTKSRYRVVLDGEIAFVLYKGELRRLHIAQGEELQENARQSIFQEILPKRAKLRCMNLLKTKDYTKKQLEDKLRQGGYPLEIIEQAVAYVESYGYINDKNYARSYIEYNMQKKSRKRIENDLSQKGISRELAGKVFEELKEDGVEMDEAAMIRELLLKKNFHFQESTYAERQKMCAFLYRKGFHADTISKVLLLDITSF
ncbi:MAG: recombination regulator RecX [Bacillus sp. (in: Bacteria)]|nr:recombination regulator RecX [Bacillus sp. (in: firmicutes)]MCM1425145.1 recombination regulator RecX [Eubacterium sp.]